ncbi:MAG: sulfotransferase [Proteobacteria bacterium]|nr:sulfotransferase [Pseudomonadota bacterium]
MSHNLETIASLLNTVNLVCVIDHSGRAGNGFFLTVFDQHPTVLSCPLMHYTYSYIISAFEDKEIPCDMARDFLLNKSYFRLLYHADDPQNLKLAHRMGMSDSAKVNSASIRTCCDLFFQSRKTVTRKDLALLPFIFYAMAHHRNLDQIKYVLVSDAISLRTESVDTGYSGKVIDVILEDFPQAKLISLVRDPRATFASPRHQFVNWLGNMYALKPGNLIARMKTLWARKLTMDNACVFLFWLLYLAQSARTMSYKIQQYQNHFISVRNEDLNLDFQNTLHKICKWLDISFDKRWDEPNYAPTILGKPWLGTGAYNNRYQTVTNGRLMNETQEVSNQIAGPNAYVTQRWQQRLNKREIRLLERLFKEELKFYQYPIMYDKENESDLKNYLCSALLPFEGELPTFGWIVRGSQDSLKECWNRVFYALTFLPFYFYTRIILGDYIFRKQFFKNIF